jgi:hypothetical protein
MAEQRRTEAPSEVAGRQGNNSRRRVLRRIWLQGGQVSAIDNQTHNLTHEAGCFTARIR